MKSGWFTTLLPESLKNSRQDARPIGNNYLHLLMLVRKQHIGSWKPLTQELSRGVRTASGRSEDEIPSPLVSLQANKVNKVPAQQLVVGKKPRKGSSQACMRRCLKKMMNSNQTSGTSMHCKNHYSHVWNAQ